MPEATALYIVVAVVVAALVVWVAAALRTAKEPWARPAVPEGGPDGSAPFAPDDTARATPVALGKRGAKDDAAP